MTDNKYTIAKTYVYTLYLLPKDTMLSREELENKGVSGLTDTNTEIGSVSTTYRKSLFKVLYICLKNKSGLLSTTTNAINHALEEEPFGIGNQGLARRVVNNFDLLQELNKISFQINKSLPLKNTSESKEVTKAINDCMVKLIDRLLSHNFIADKVFYNLTELGVIENYEERYTYDKWTLGETTHV